MDKAFEKVTGKLGKMDIVTWLDTGLRKNDARSPLVDPYVLLTTTLMSTIYDNCVKDLKFIFVTFFFFPIFKFKDLLR